MIEIKGTYNTAKIFTDTCDSATIAQVTNLMNQPSAAGAKVRIMPDCHAGAGCVIGTTMTITDKVIPNLVGVDIGCGMLATKLKEQRIDLPKFDSVSQAEVPAGMRMRKTPHSMAAEMSPEELACYGKSGCKVNVDVFRLSLGTLGGGAEGDVHQVFVQAQAGLDESGVFPRDPVGGGKAQEDLSAAVADERAQADETHRAALQDAL